MRGGKAEANFSRKGPEVRSPANSVEVIPLGSQSIRPQYPLGGLSSEKNPRIKVSQARASGDAVDILIFIFLAQLSVQGVENAVDKRTRIFGTVNLSEVDGL